MKENFNY